MFATTKKKSGQITLLVPKKMQFLNEIFFERFEPIMKGLNGISCTMHQELKKRKLLLLCCSSKALVVGSLQGLKRKAYDKWPFPQAAVGLHRLAGVVAQLQKQGVCTNDNKFTRRTSFCT